MKINIDTAKASSTKLKSMLRIEDSFRLNSGMHIRSLIKDGQSPNEDIELTEQSFAELTTNNVLYPINKQSTLEMKENITFSN